MEVVYRCCCGIDVHKNLICEMAAMESTGPYWKPLYNLFELLGLDAMIVNAAHMKAVPGRVDCGAAPARPFAGQLRSQPGTAGAAGTDPLP